jgi:hypothetical protein
MTENSDDYEGREGDSITGSALLFPMKLIAFLIKGRPSSLAWIKAWALFF